MQTSIQPNSHYTHYNNNDVGNTDDDILLYFSRSRSLSSLLLYRLKNKTLYHNLTFLSQIVENLNEFLKEIQSKTLKV